MGSGALFSGPCFTGVLPLSSFLLITIWVTSLGSVLQSDDFAESQFYLMFSGSPNGPYAPAFRRSHV